MAINRTPFNALIDDDGSGTTGTPWNKARIAGVILDPVDASLADVALKNAANTFTQDQTIESSTTPQLNFLENDQPVDQRYLRLVAGNGGLFINATNDANTVASSLLSLTRDGDATIGRKLTVTTDIYEKARTTPMGHWSDVPFSAANFSANGGGTWTIGAAAVLVNRYALMGKTLHWRMYVSWFSGSNTVAGTVSSLNIALPGGAMGLDQTSLNPIAYGFDGGVVTAMHANIGGPTWISIYKTSGSNFTAGAVGVAATMTFEIV